MKFKKPGQQLTIFVESTYIGSTKIKGRRLKVQNGPYKEKGTPFPMLRLHGKWLLNAGFNANTIVNVEIKECCSIVITKADN